MQYFGGKTRIAKQLIAVMGPIARARGCYVEPFVGGASLMSRMLCDRRIASDANVALITMWLALADGWKPPEALSETDYAALKKHNDPLNPLTAFAGFGCSFAGKWFGGYARNKRGANYAADAASSLRKKMIGLERVQWCAGDYRSCPTPERCAIYCDPPYAGTTQYGAVAPFAWEPFWQYCRDRQAAGHVVMVSEYSAPDDFREVLAIDTKTEIRTKSGRAPRVEKLFTPCQ